MIEKMLVEVNKQVNYLLVGSKAKAKTRPSQISSRWVQPRFSHEYVTIRKTELPLLLCYSNTRADIQIKGKSYTPTVNRKG